MDSCLRGVAVFCKPKTILRFALAYQINVNMIQRYCSCPVLMLECTFSRKYGINQLFKHGVARMTMLEKGTGLQWRPLVYSDLLSGLA